LLAADRKGPRKKTGLEAAGNNTAAVSTSAVGPSFARAHSSFGQQDTRIDNSCQCVWSRADVIRSGVSREALKRSPGSRLLSTVKVRSLDVPLPASAESGCDGRPRACSDRQNVANTEIAGGGVIFHKSTARQFRHCQSEACGNCGDNLARVVNVRPFATLTLISFIWSKKGRINWH